MHIRARCTFVCQRHSAACLLVPSFCPAQGAKQSGVLKYALACGAAVLWPRDEKRSREEFWHLLLEVLLPSGCFLTACVPDTAELSQPPASFRASGPELWTLLPGRVPHSGHSAACLFRAALQCTWHALRIAAALLGLLLCM